MIFKISTPFNTKRDRTKKIMYSWEVVLNCFEPRNSRRGERIKPQERLPPAVSFVSYSVSSAIVNKNNKFFNSMDNLSNECWVSKQCWLGIRHVLLFVNYTEIIGTSNSTEIPVLQIRSNWRRFQFFLLSSQMTHSCAKLGLSTLVITVVTIWRRAWERHRKLKFGQIVHTLLEKDISCI